MRKIYYDKREKREIKKEEERGREREKE